MAQGQRTKVFSESVARCALSYIAYLEASQQESKEREKEPKGGWIKFIKNLYRLEDNRP